MVIFSLIAMTRLEKCCITSTYLQWLCHLGERPMAVGLSFYHSPLVKFSVKFNCFFFFFFFFFFYFKISHIHMKYLLTFYILLHRKRFFLIFWKPFRYMTMFKLDFLNEKTAILNRDANDKIRGIQLIGPNRLLKVLSRVN